MAVAAMATTAQIAQKSSGCRSGSWFGAGSCWEEACNDGVAACVAIGWKWPNDNTSWIASANSARCEPRLVFERNRFILWHSTREDLYATSAVETFANLFKQCQRSFPHMMQNSLSVGF